MDGGNHAHEEVEANTIAFLKAGREYFCPDEPDSQMRVARVWLSGSSANL